MKRFKTSRRFAGLVIVASLLMLPLASLATSYIDPGSSTAYAANCDPVAAQKPKDGEKESYKLDPSCNDPSRSQKCKNGECLFENYLQPGLNLMAAIVGLACAGSYIAAGIRYETSADNSQKVSDAKQRIVTTTFVLIGFFVFYAFMKYLIPGGV